jgi:hypothetical protein
VRLFHNINVSFKKGGNTLKYIKYLVVFVGVFTFLISGCSSIENEEQKINVQKRFDTNNYKDFKEITKNVEVQQVKKILNKADWVDAKVDMVRRADYRFAFQFKDPNIQAKAVLYELWISPNNEQVELVIDIGSKYVQLNKKKSAELLEILTDKKLSGKHGKTRGRFLCLIF